MKAQRVLLFFISQRPLTLHKLQRFSIKKDEKVDYHSERLTVRLFVFGARIANEPTFSYILCNKLTKWHILHACTLWEQNKCNMIFGVKGFEKI